MTEAHRRNAAEILQMTGQERQLFCQQYGSLGVPFSFFNISMTDFDSTAKEGQVKLSQNHSGI